MKLVDLGTRSLPPDPQFGMRSLPWSDPAFSSRMLEYHLSQHHNSGSRRTDEIGRQVAWINETLLGRRPTAILDIGCGPGLYTSRLSRLGHSCTGVDCSPAAIDHAKAEAESQQLECRYLQSDLNDAAFSEQFGLAMMIYAGLNLLQRDEATMLLRKVRRWLGGAGILLLEAYTLKAVQHIGEAGQTWSTMDGSLFCDVPHLVLVENFWHASAHSATTRYFVAEFATGDVFQFGQILQAYTEEGYRALLEESGFAEVSFLPSLTGSTTPADSDLCVIVAR